MTFAATKTQGLAHVAYLKPGSGPADKPLHEAYLPTQLPVCQFSKVKCTRANRHISNETAHLNEKYNEICTHSHYNNNNNNHNNHNKCM